MDLKTFMKSLPSEAERESFARRCGTSLGHLRNVMYGYKRCATNLAVSIERESGAVVSRPELRPDWAQHWPDLMAHVRDRRTDHSLADRIPASVDRRAALKARKRVALGEG